jgi:hypothetical protein
MSAPLPSLQSLSPALQSLSPALPPRIQSPHDGSLDTLLTNEDRIKWKKSPLRPRLDMDTSVRFSPEPLLPNQVRMERLAWRIIAVASVMNTILEVLAQEIDSSEELKRFGKLMSEPKMITFKMEIIKDEAEMMVEALVAQAAQILEKACTNDEDIMKLETAISFMKLPEERGRLFVVISPQLIGLPLHGRLHKKPRPTDVMQSTYEYQLQMRTLQVILRVYRKASELVSTSDTGVNKM